MKTQLEKPPKSNARDIKRRKAELKKLSEKLLKGVKGGLGNIDTGYHY